MRVKAVHLFLGLLRDPQNAAVRIIEQLGMHAEQVRAGPLRHLESEEKNA